MHPGVFAAKEPERPAVIMGAAGPVVTYAELEARSNQVAWLARRCGLRPGDGLAVIAENRPELFDRPGARSAPACSSPPSTGT